MLNIPSEVKTILLTDGTRKNYRIKFPNGERADITNDNIVKDSVKFTESMCSQNEIKFGLCEASTFECEVVEIENIKGFKIFVQMEVDCSLLGTEWCAANAQTSEDVDFPFYAIPYGAFTIDSCQKQADMSHRKIVAYSYGFDFKINRIELFKQGLKTANSIKYKTNFYKYFLANINEIDAFGFEKEKANYHFNEEQYEYLNFTITNEYMSFIIGLGSELNQIYKIQANWNKAIVDAYKEYARQELYNTLQFNSNVSMTYLERTFYDFIEPKNGVTSICFYPYFTDLNSYFTNASYEVNIPYKLTVKQYEWGEDHTDEHLIETRVFDMGKENCKVYRYIIDDDPLNGYLMTLDRVKDSYDGRFNVGISNMNFPREQVEAIVEMSGLFMKYNRQGEIELSGVENISGLYPSETLYPSESLFPKGTQGYSVPSTYSSAWYEDTITNPFGRVCATYKEDNNEEAYVYVDIVDDYEEHPEKYSVYDMSNNYIIRESTHLAVNVENWMQTVAESIKNVRYMPCEIKALGMPWLEAGDTIALETTDGDIIKTIILSRTIVGEQYLTDTFESK